MGRVINKIGHSERERRDIHFIPNDDSDYDEQRKKKSGNIKNLSDQRCVAKSSNQPTRTVQAGRDFVQVVGIKLKRRD